MVILEKWFGVNMGPIWGLKSPKNRYFGFLGSYPPSNDFKNSFTCFYVRKYINVRKYIRLWENWAIILTVVIWGSKVCQNDTKIWENFVNWLKVDEILLKSISNYFYRILQRKLGLGKWKPVKIKIFIFFGKKIPRISDFGNFLLKVAIVNTVLNILL